MWRIFKKKFPLLLLELLLVSVVIWAQFSSVPAIKSVRQASENMIYDFMVRAHINRPKMAHVPVVIIDIDEKSLRVVGRWPWPRNTLAQLVRQLKEAGVAVIAFDMIFSKGEPNVAEAFVQEIQKVLPLDPGFLKFAEKIAASFDYDADLAAAFQEADTVLGIIFHNDKTNPSVGKLLPPAFILTESEQRQCVIPTMPNYWANLPYLQDAAKGAGFITVIPDDDGVIRRSPLLLRYQDGVYLSLALEAARLYLLLDKVIVKIIKMGDAQVIESVRLGSLEIPTDALGQVLIPYQGPEKTLPYLSAADVLNNVVDKKQLENALVFVGTSALGMADLHATPVQAAYPGVEIQATIAAGLLAGYFPYSPVWVKGAELTISVVVGMMGVIAFPYLGSIGLFFAAIGSIAAMITLSIFLWQTQGMLISILMPSLLILLLVFTNLDYGYLFEYRSRRKLKNIFEHYIPVARVEALSEGPARFSLKGETRELTVLFCDIIGFTTLAEKLSAAQVKDLLNRFLTPMTQIIFNHNGTIDKYVGDMIMAFWGAPLSDSHHAKHALEAALDMIAALEKLKPELIKRKLPVIDVGIGINTGMVNVGDMGSEFRLAYTVIGDAVNQASRIEGLTRHYGVHVAIGEKTQQKFPQDFIYRKLDRVRVKGKKQAIAIFELVCRKADASQVLLDQLTLHDKALLDYFMQRWDSAYQGFSELHKQHPEVKLYQLYLDRIRYLRDNPPGKEWDGVYEWHVK